MTFLLLFSALLSDPQLHIIHIADWHFVPRDLFYADLKDQGQNSQEKLAEAYELHLDKVEAVQKEQLVILRKLISKHKLKAVYIEGATNKNISLFKQVLEIYRENPKLVTRE